ncbi:hypothetical protein [Lentilactobacillus diolivorans]|uniref:Uncharacterized protein n=1 Tax=Lentilactobacillus diolivorans TaxID=179838 RepID=A0ABQ0XIW9_9LACO|nr:hypothetical protein [Lentilactobacillus diolivorans]GEP23355.1 hypothetical protein LDI01_09480 [Lentilactobacillus diolivorans]
MTSKMRTKLREKGSKNRCYFSGEFKKYGFKYSDRNKSHALPTILLMNIKLSEERFAFPRNHQ